MSTGMSSLLKILFVNSLCNAANLADFHLKCSIFVENPKSNISGSTLFFSREFRPPAEFNATPPLQSPNRRFRCNIFTCA